MDTPRPKSTPPTRPIPLEDLRTHQDELRARAGVPRSPVPQPVDPAEDTTARLGRAVFTGTAAGPVDIDRVVDRFADRIADRVKRDTSSAGGGGGGRIRTEVQGWLRLAFGLLAGLGGAWWALGEKLNDRPTLGAVKEMIEPLRATQADHDRELRQQRDLLIEVRQDVKGIAHELAEPAPRRRR